MSLIYDMSNEDYHGEKTAFSSSQLKTILESPELFYNKYILGRDSMKDSPALRIGNAVHTKILEPEKFEDEYAIYDGIKKGKAWTEFQEANAGKIILSQREMIEVNVATDNVFNTDATVPFINGGRPEVSLFTELEGVKIKVRADYLNEKLSYIQDVKTTTDMVNELTTRRKIAQFDYDLSAAMYLDAFNTLGLEIKDFIWIFTSKKYQTCKVFKASEEMIENGRVKYKRALEQIKKYQAKNWDITNDVVTIDPIEYDLQIGDTVGHDDIFGGFDE